jgi:hypothetical protein
MAEPTNYTTQPLSAPHGRMGGFALVKPGNGGDLKIFINHTVIDGMVVNIKFHHPFLPVGFGG